MGDMVPSACRDLDLWPSDLISMSQAQVQTSFNFGEISSTIYKDIVLITRFFGSLPAVTFDPQSQSAHLRTQIHLWPKLGEIPFIGFFRYGVHKVFGTHSFTHLLIPGQTWIQYANGTVIQRWQRHKNTYQYPLHIACGKIARVSPCSFLYFVVIYCKQILQWDTWNNFMHFEYIKCCVLLRSSKIHDPKCFIRFSLYYHFGIFEEPFPVP